MHHSFVALFDRLGASLCIIIIIIILGMYMGGNSNLVFHIKDIKMAAYGFCCRLLVYMAYIDMQNSK